MGLVDWEYPNLGYYDTSLNLYQKINFRYLFVFKQITEVYERVTNTKIPNQVCSLALDIMAEDFDGKDIDDLPYIRYTFR